MQTLNDKISHARGLGEGLRSASDAPFPSVGALLRERCAQTPSKVFLIWYDAEGNHGQLTYADFLTQVNQRAAALLGMGLMPGDRVATYSGNFPETVLSYFACWMAGLTVVPINVKEDAGRIRWTLINSRARTILTRPELMGALEAVLSGGDFRGVKVVSEPFGEAYAAAITDVSNEPDREALIVYTSGTTGNPKGVVLDHFNLVADAQALTEWHRVGPDTRMMCVLPIHHVNGTVVTLLTPLYAGSSVVLNERFSAHHFFPRIAAEKVSIVSVVPTLLAFLLEANAAVDGLEISQLRHIICGAGPLTVDLAMRWEERYHIPIAHGYGLSETTCYSCCLPVDLDTATRRRWLSEFGYPSIGAAFPVNEMAIHNSDGKPLPAGERGEIVIRGHNVMKGYFANDEANQSAFAHGWFRSGDEGFWLPGENGVPYYFITGRLKELIIRGGVNISPFEVDEVLMSLPGVLAGIAVGFAHDLYGEEVGAYVQPDGTRALTEADVIAACREKLPYFKCPKVVLFGDDIPVTSTGKYQRNRLKHLFEPYKGARFKE